ncbi:hypothetical protein WJX82_010851 [Trebouxia sp. C0006]
MTFVDEEEALSFNVWVAELELLVGNARGNRRVDPIYSFELLQKLQGSIRRSERAQLQSYQRKCEDALTIVLLKGAPPPVRQLVAGCLVSLYLKGDTLPLYSRISSLQQFLSSKEAFSQSLPKQPCLGCLECLAALSTSLSNQIVSSLPGTMAVAVKQVSRNSDPAIQCMALRLVAAVVEGLGSSDRNLAALHTDALKAADKCLKDKSVSTANKSAAGAVIKAVAEAGGSGLWSNAGSAFDDIVRTCVLALVDPSLTVREVFAAALGEIAAASNASSAKDAIAGLDSKPSKKAALEQIVSQAVSTCLTKPLAEAAAANNRQALTALAQAWIAYLASMQAKYSADEPFLINTAAKLVELLASLGSSRASGVAVSDSGSAPGNDLGPGQGEMPHAQAAVLYVIRVGVMEQLSETGQRALLERLTGLISTPVGDAVPAGVVALESMRLIVEVVGEVSSDEVHQMRQPCITKLTAHPQPLQAQAAGVLSALAVAEPSSAAQLLQECLEKLAAQDSVLGFATGSAALVSAATRLSLGIPSSLLMSALELATKCIREVAPEAGVGAQVVMEAGYMVLGAMCVALPQDMMDQRQEDLLSLWQTALSAEAAQSLDMKRYLTASLAAAESEMLTEVQWRVAALEALHAFVLGPCTRCAPMQAATLTATCASLLQPTLDAVCAAPALQDPWRSGSGPNSPFAGAAALLQLRLLQAYLLLPKAGAFAPEHASLLRLCASALKGTSAPSGRLWASACGMHSLQQLLDNQDSVLGPAVPGRDPLLDALNSFVGTPGSPALRPWEQGLPNQTDPAGQLAGSGDIASSAMPFPQAWSLSGALQEAQLQLLGKVMGMCAPAEQALVDRYKGEGFSEEAVAASTHALATAVLDQGAVSEDACLMRAAAQLYACAACIGTDAAATQLMQTVCKDMAQTPLPARRASLALAVGCIYRSKGGMSLQLGVANAVASLTAVSQACKGAVQLWILHGLCLTANAAGLAYVPYCKGSLAVATQMLMSEEAYAVPGLRAALGRLANSVVAVLGPELSPGTDVYTKCKALIREVQGFGSAGSGGLREEDWVAGELEGVLYIQSLILFAPQAVPAKVDSDIAAHIQATLTRLLETGAPEQVSYWLAVCSEVALAAAASPTADQQATQAGLDRDGGSEEGASDTDEEDRHTSAALPTPASQPGQTAESSPAAAVLAGARRAAGTPRLRTRHFAISCILAIPTAVGDDPRHFDLKAAQTSGTGDWMVVKLQSLVDTGFRLASGQLESLRPLGLNLLQAVLHHFGSVEDPLLEDHLILEQYRAQFVSALRSCLDSEAPPSLTAAAAALAGGFVEAGLAGSDPALLTRLMAQLIALLKAKASKRQQQLYSEWVPLQAYLALLQAHAQFATAGESVLDADSRQVVQSAQQPHHRQLVAAWVAVVQDYAVLGTHGPLVQAAYTPRLFPAPSLSIIARLQPNLHSCWPAALAALAVTLPQAAGDHSLMEVMREGDLTALLLDVCELALCRVSNPEFREDRLLQPGSDLKQLQAALSALQAVLALKLSSSPLSLELCCDLMLLLIDIAQMLASMRQEASRQQAPAALAYCHITLAISQVLHAASQAAPASVLSRHEFVTLATDALLLCLPLTACLVPVSGNGFSSHNEDGVGVGQYEQAQLATALMLGALPVMQTVSSGWGMTGLDRLLRAALTAAQLSNPLAAQPAAEPQHSKAASHNSPSVSPPDLLLSTVTTLAHMLETQASFDSSQSKFQRGRQQSNSADAARQLGVILSLVVFVGSLSCSSGSGSSSAAQAVSADSDAQTHEDGSGAERRQVSQDEAVPETDGAESPRLQQGINLDDSSQDRQRAVQLDGGGQPQQAHTVAECLRACQEACLQVLQQAVGGHDAALLVQVLRSVRPDTNQQDKVGTREWSCACLAAVLPGAVRLLHKLLAPSQAAQLSADQLQVVAEAIRLLLTAISLVSSEQNSELEQRLMAVLLSVLISDIAPRVSASPALADVAVKLVTQIASGSSATAFKAVVTSLPPQDKLKLQAAMQAVTQPATKSSQTTSPQPKSKTATITLKNFAASNRS